VIVTFVIGNSDDKLGQNEWARFAEDLVDVAERATGAFSDDADTGARIHFLGCSPAIAPWQNMLCAIDLGDGPHVAVLRGQLRSELAELCGKYRQDAIAWWETDRAEMIPPAVPE
jgi:hypothetical protein